MTGFVRLTTGDGNPMWVRIGPETTAVVWGETVKTPATGGLPGKDRVEASTRVDTKVSIPTAGTWTVKGDPDEIARLLVMDERRAYKRPELLDGAS